MTTQEEYDYRESLRVEYGESLGWPYSSSISFESVPLAPEVEVRFKDTPIDKAVQAVRDAQRLDRSP